MHKNITFIGVDKKNIAINDEFFNLNDLNKYSSKINFANKDLNNVSSFAISFIEENTSELNPLSVAFLINTKFEDVFETRFQKAFAKHIKSTCYNIVNGDFFEGIKKMKGSGIGLTPSGDDFITGMLYAFFLLENIENKDRSKLRNDIYEASKSNNDISRNMIFHASKGLYFKQFKDFQEALINKDKNLKQKLKELINIGETSGSDMLTGFYIILKMLK